MEDKLNYEDFIPLLGMWAEQFRPFIEGKEMWNIYQRLKEDGKKEVIVPSSDVTFRSFAESAPYNIKSVWYLMDPYPRRYKNRANQATGIPMDCTNSPDGHMQPSLELFYDGIDKDMKIEVERSLSLKYLLEQGVLLLNSDLTCKLNKTGSHARLWEPFQKYFLEDIMAKQTGIVYVLAGKVSERMEKYIQPLGNYILKVEHPAAAAHSGTDWNHKHVFSITNKLLKDNGKDEIYWDKREWDIVNECPF